MRDAVALEYVIRIPVDALRPTPGLRGRTVRSAEARARVQALTDLLTVLSADPPLIWPGRWTIRILNGSVDITCHVDMPPPPTPRPAPRRHGCPLTPVW